MVQILAINDLYRVNYLKVVEGSLGNMKSKWTDCGNWVVNTKYVPGFAPSTALILLNSVIIYLVRVLHNQFFDQQSSPITAEPN